ncbi:hypothetical protein ABZ079_34040 [Streptomyces sp. NPDC006314]|uniref:hypothetical protein n=1 Tax=Streptomyces sp. NPDC006314 TaxID=3154475 RepID=UPI0033BE4796
MSRTSAPVPDWRPPSSTPEARTFLAEERILPTEVFPDGTVQEQYLVSLAVALR